MTDTNKQFEEAAARVSARTPFIVVAERNDGGGDIVIKGLTVKTPGHNAVTLVDKIDLTIKKGERVVLTGKSGSGKTLTAKAILNLHDYGSGLVVLPSGIKILPMSQQAYFPNTNLRGIMNLAPESRITFKDEQLAEALQSVGLDQLIQQIPGQQVRLMMDDLLAKIAAMPNPHQGEILTGRLAAQIREEVKPLAAALVAAQFNTVQCVPAAQKEYFREKFSALLAGKYKCAPEDVTALSDRIVDDIDIELVRPLNDHLARVIPETADRKRGKILPMTASKASYFAWNLERSLAKQLNAYRGNKDTDDKNREIRINATQADFIAQSVAQKMREELAPHVRSGPLSQIFNAVTAPLSFATLALKAGKVAGDLTQRLTYFMHSQIVTGDTLKLSGGERQMLTIAMVLLHKPDLLILDEITAALDRETGEKLYRDMMEKIPEGTTVISIAHNEHILKYHTHHAHLADKTITVHAIDRDYLAMLAKKSSAFSEPAPKNGL